MKYNELDTVKMKSPKRKGRGISSGKGKTAGRGTKGQGSRAGGRRRPGFEGGQTPLMQRLPKLRGIAKGAKTTSNKIHHDKKFEQITTGKLNKVSSKTIDNFSLFEEGLITSPHTYVKIITKGEIKSKINVKLQAASKSAEDMIKKAGGSIEIIERIPRQPKDKK